MKSKKIILSILIFILVLIIGTLKVNATTEVNTPEQLVNVLGKENVQLEGNTIILKNDIVVEKTIKITSGDYIIDLNGKTILYDKDYENAFWIEGSFVTIKDTAGNGRFVSNASAIFCDKGFLKIEKADFFNIKEWDIGSIYAHNNGVIQIEDGNFGYVGACSGNIIINGGTFRESLCCDIEPYSDKPIIRINGGEFERGLSIYRQNNDYDILLKGGRFKTENNKFCAITLSGNKNLNILLDNGYKFTNNEQTVETYETDEEPYYMTYCINETAVVKKAENYKSENLVIFMDENGNILKKDKVLDGESANAPEMPEKDGYIFLGWSEDIQNVNKDMVVTPKYHKIYKLCLQGSYFETYTGNKIKPYVKVGAIETLDALVEGIDYELEYSNNINAGTAFIKITGKGKYEYSFGEGTFEINKVPFNSNNMVLTVNGEFIYDGIEKRPDVILKQGDKALVKDVDYTLDYHNNINAGYAMITVNGIGNYNGTLQTGFRINSKQLTNSSINVDTLNKEYTGDYITPNVVVKDGNKILEKNKDYYVYYNDNMFEGTATITIRATGNYSGEFERKFNIIISKKNITQISNISIDTANKVYTGSNIKTSIVLKNGTNTLEEGTDYTVTYTNNKNYGTATVTITGKGNYEGVITKTFKIVPRKISITSLKNRILRIVTINWNKDTSVSGYEIYRSTNQNGTYSLVKKVTKNSTNSTTFVAQKKGTYYYKVRSYVTVNGVKIYGDFSDIQKIIVSK